MVTFQPMIEGEDPGGRKQECRGAELGVFGVTGKEHRGKADAVAAKSATDLSEARTAFDQEMPAIRHELLDFGEHTGHQIRLTGSEGDDYGFRVLATKPEIQTLESRPDGQWNSTLTTSPDVPSRLSSFGV